MKTTTISCSGKKSEEAVQIILTWIIDGGGEDILTDLLADNGISVENMTFDLDKKSVTFELQE